MQELFQLVQDELIKADCIGRIPAGLVVSGGGSQLKGCAEVAQQVMGMTVRIGKPYGVGGLGETLTHPMYATGIGLVQYGAHQLSVAQQLEDERGSSVQSFWQKLLQALKRSFWSR